MPSLKDTDVESKYITVNLPPYSEGYYDIFPNHYLGKLYCCHYFKIEDKFKVSILDRYVKAQ